MAASSAALRTWLESNGAIIHPSVEIKQDADFGLSTWATDSLPADSTVLSLPFELAVTPERAEQAIVGVLPVGRGEGEAQVRALEERIKVLVYLVLHWIGQEKTDIVDSSSPLLAHYPYLHSLPSPDSLFTPLYFSSAERDLLEGTSVSGAAREMEQTWRQDHERVGKVLGLTVEDGFTWERYLLASTYLSSRAFPSRLLHLPTPEDPTPSTDSHPILLPGIDLLNHQPLHPVSWISSPATAATSFPSTTSSASVPSPSSPSSAGRIAVVLPSPTPAGEQVWNNYGGKPNDELLLAYGFTLPSLSYDTSPLLLAASSIPPASAAALKLLRLDVSKRFLVGRDGVVGGELRCAVRALVGDKAERHSMLEWEADGGERLEDGPASGWWNREVSGENEMNAVEVLLGMVGGRLTALRAGAQAGEAEQEGVRDEVRRIVGVYRQGQIEILEAAERYLSSEMERVATENGFDLDGDEDEEEEE